MPSGDDRQGGSEHQARKAVDNRSRFEVVRVPVRVQPGASRDEVSGWENGTLRVKLRARALEGKANRSLLDFLAQVLNLRPYQVTLIKGERSREKLLEVDLPSHEEVEARLEATNGG